MKKVLLVGCSYAKGYGLPGEENNPQLWTNHLFDESYTVTNLSRNGANNQWIFLEALGELRKSQYDIVIVSWSAIPRFDFNVGLELHSTHTLLQPPYRDVDIVNGHTVKGSWLAEIGKRLRQIHNDHWDILNLVKYVNTLIDIQCVRQQSIFFVNALLPWCSDYFNYKQISLPSELDPYVQNLLDVDIRDDSEVFALYNMIHEQYRKYGGIRPKHWLNLYSSLRSVQIDDISESDSHPGVNSQAVFIDHLKPILNQKLNETSHNHNT